MTGMVEMFGIRKGQVGVRSKAGIVAIAGLLAAGSAQAQSVGSTGTTATKPVAKSSTTAAQASGMNTTDPKNGGVAGTGMGGTPQEGVTPSNGLGASPDTAGTGQSVPGPAGSGLSTESAGPKAGQTNAGTGGLPSPKP